MENPHASTTDSRLRDFTRMNNLSTTCQRLIIISKSLWMRSTRFYISWELMNRQSLSWLHISSKCGTGVVPNVGRWPSTTRCPHHLDFLKTVFLERFFYREQQEAKVEEFINLRQEGMSVKEYSLKFFKLSEYTSSLVAISMDKMRRFVTGVLEDLVDDCRAAMLHGYIDLGRMMVHAQHVE